MTGRRGIARAVGAGVLLLMIAVGLVPGSAGCASSRSDEARGPLAALRDEFKPQIAKPVADSLSAALAKTNGPVVRPQNALVLSAGGQYAAFDAGLLVGWTKAGTRPQFDVVTGISGGAVAAAFAFLGEKYDGNLQQFFTGVRNRDLFVYRPVIELIRNGSLADPTRLEKLIETEVNDCYLQDLRAAHGQGRRLYIGTMNVRTRRLCIWDIGAIACSDRPDAGLLVRKIYQAAVSIPGLLPSVPFDIEVDGVRYTEEHADGGAASQAFLRLGPGGDRPADGVTGWLKGSNLYVMSAGKLYAPEVEGKLGFLKRATSSVSAALYALFRAELTCLYAFCGVSGMQFHLIAVPPEVDIPASSMNFDPEGMRKLFGLGYCEATKAGGITWRLTPPGTEPGEEEAPRTTPPLFPAQKR